MEQKYFKDLLLYVKLGTEVEMSNDKTIRFWDLPMGQMIVCDGFVWFGNHVLSQHFILLFVVHRSVCSEICCKIFVLILHTELN